jgi:hypothetical protein
MHGVDELYAVYDEKDLVARKQHVCCACDEPIRPRQRYYRVAILFGGRWQTVRRCERCQRMHKHLRDVGGDWDEWPDEDLNCGHEYGEVHGRPPPPEIAALAFALPGDGDDGGGE